MKYQYFERRVVSLAETNVISNSSGYIQDSNSGGLGDNPKKIWITSFELLQMRGNTLFEKSYKFFGQTSRATF